MVLKQKIKTNSPCKINLGLWVKEKRNDGYHNIETIFYEVKNLTDELIVEFSQDSTKLNINVAFSDKQLNESIPNESNFCFKAAKLFLEEINIFGNCSIFIKKNIPLQAGLGGGSANAAIVLRTLNKLFNSPLSESKLLELALKIGSDVPFFILGETCIGKGRGEILTKIKNNIELEIKILKLKNISIPTKWAYDELDKLDVEDHSKKITNIISALKNNDKNLLFQNLFNDFEKVVFKKHPELLDEKEKLLNSGFKAILLCGSGSAICGIK